MWQWCQLLSGYPGKQPVVTSIQRILSVLFWSTDPVHEHCDCPFMWPQLQSFNDDDQFIATLTDLNIVPTLTGCCWQHILNFGLHTMFESRFTVATIVKKEIKLGGSITLWNQLLLFQSVALQVAPLVQVKQLSDIHHLLLIREGFRCYFGPLVACYQPTGWSVPNESKGAYEINILPPSPLLQTDYRDLFVPTSLSDYYGAISD